MMTMKKNAKASKWFAWIVSGAKCERVRSDVCPFILFSFWIDLWFLVPVDFLPLSLWRCHCHPCYFLPFPRSSRRIFRISSCTVLEWALDTRCPAAWPAPSHSLRFSLPLLRIPVPPNGCPWLHAGSLRGSDREMWRMRSTDREYRGWEKRCWWTSWATEGRCAGRVDRRIDYDDDARSFFWIDVGVRGSIVRRGCDRDNNSAHSRWKSPEWRLERREANRREHRTVDRREWRERLRRG